MEEGGSEVHRTLQPGLHETYLKKQTKKQKQTKYFHMLVTVKCEEHIKCLMFDSISIQFILVTLVSISC